MVPHRAKSNRRRQVVKNAFRDWGIFTLFQASVCLAVYGSALWGARLLAPLDIAPAIFPAYRFVDPTSNGVPNNHYIIDQLIYDLPLQTVIYDAYQRGEIPWWDPYTYGGRPLLADAHINGTDPIRIVCYLTLPFELAYNWNLVLHSLVAAAGMFALLRFWRFGLFTCAILAVAWQFSGAFVLHFGHPWIAGTFVWFPLIWLFWERTLTKERALVRNTAYAAFLCAAVFYSGNLQSHLYLPVFALAFLLGRLFTDRQALLRATASVAVSGLLGAALAAPVIANQVEFFLLSTREVAGSLEWWQHPMKVLLSLGGVFPWATGTFRTLDIGKLVNASGTAWLLFCGSATFMLALVGLFGFRTLSKDQVPLWGISLGLVSVYLLIAGTPLAHIFYLRVAPLAVLGLVPLAAIGLQLVTSDKWIVRPKLAWTTATGILVVLASLNIATFLIFPAVKDRLTQAALAADAGNTNFPAGAATLRVFQIENLPAEMSLLNLETLLSSVSLLLISAALGASTRRYRTILAYSALIISLLPLITFATRFIPDHPAEMLSRLQTGGTFQQKAIALVRDNNGRILDRDTEVFPYAMGAIYRIHTVHGYSALQPTGIFKRPAGTSLTQEYGSDLIIGLTAGNNLTVEERSSPPHQGRFWSSSGQRIVVIRETLNSLQLRSENGQLAPFYRTDTPYPGWTVSPSDETTMSTDGVATLFGFFNSQAPQELTLIYRPTHLMAAVLVASVAAIVLLAAFLAPTRISQGQG
jgi:hypothetical protein